jgi:hypothetical protein|tara:strand:+ start:8566 stop:9066 length:501 start_codon:yes stop_codon:yes gene_type:complete
MKLFLAFSLIMLTSFTSIAHEYFFGFAELSYNSTDQVIEGTLMLSTHDLEEWFQIKKLPVKELEDHVSDEKLIQQMASTLFSEFKIKNNGTSLKLQLIGYEVLPNGMTNFYFHSNKTEKPQKLDFTFDLMMNELPKQQNKITYLDKQKSYTAVFVSTKKQSSIIIE